MKPLYQLVEQHRALERLDPEEIDEQTLADTLEALEGEITIKATSCAAMVLNIEAFADAVAGAAEQMHERSMRLRRKAEWARAYLLNNMKGAGISKVQSPEFVVTVRKNPPTVMISPEAKIPAEYMVTPEPPPPRVDKAKLKEALKAGTTIDGAWLEQGERLEIK